MENNKKKGYYKPKKNNYYHKNNQNSVVNNKKMTYDSIVNVRSDITEIDDNLNNTKDNEIFKIVALSITIIAIIFGTLLLFHLF